MPGGGLRYNSPSHGGSSGGAQETDLSRARTRDGGEHRPPGRVRDANPRKPARHPTGPDGARARIAAAAVRRRRSGQSGLVLALPVLRRRPLRLGDADAHDAGQQEGPQRQGPAPRGTPFDHQGTTRQFPSARPPASYRTGVLPPAVQLPGRPHPDRRGRLRHRCRGTAGRPHGNRRHAQLKVGHALACQVRVNPYRVAPQAPPRGYTHQPAALISATAPPTFTPNSTGRATSRIGTTSSATASTVTAAAAQTAKRSHHGARSRSPHRPRTTTANIAR